MKNDMEIENKDFKSFPVRAVRLSDKTWEELKIKRNKSGLSWNRFILELINKK